MPERRAEFDALSQLGWELVQAHLLKTLPALKLAELEGKGSDTVEAVRYSPQEQAVWINATQCFKPVPQEVWEFHIGGYRVLEKYLKSRKGRDLSLAEIEHVRDIRPRAFLHRRPDGEDRRGLCGSVPPLTNPLSSPARLAHTCVSRGKGTQVVTPRRSRKMSVIARLVRVPHFLLTKLGRPHEAGDDDFFVAERASITTWVPFPRA